MSVNAESGSFDSEGASNDQWSPEDSVTFRRDGLTLRGSQWRCPQPRGQVLFLHGGGQTRHAWGAGARLVRMMGWTATTLDLRGHGDSDWASGGNEYRLADHADDVRYVAENLGGGVVLVGASLGGLASLTVAGSANSPARALVLVDIVPRLETAGTKRIVAFMTDHLDGFDDLDAVADAVADYTHRDRPRNLESLKKNVRLGADGRWHWHWDSNMFSASRRNTPDEGISPAATLAAATRVEVPVLLIRGLNSDVVSDDGIAEMRRAVRDITIVEVPGAGHMVAGDDNDRFVDALRSFLDRLDNPSQPI
jgi:pimeloyl-ACP methyl ester carboxylesterase